ncbi:MAG: hypothetical protein QNI87_11270 [Erythrobacter sp.]|uniref:hypothetical protein n=1 Tax=Erythrobacter sp. TaxID=1042 RepID=UPI002624A946|nr:hypothetical protein [Erythrobacter sp.]MDJ0979097.1 hypothetical protein [Erythrobacter sp.]
MPDPKAAMTRKSPISPAFWADVGWLAPAKMQVFRKKGPALGRSHKVSEPAIKNVALWVVSQVIGVVIDQAMNHQDKDGVNSRLFLSGW